MTLTRSSTANRYVSLAVLVLALLTIYTAIADELEPVPDQPAAEDFSLRDLDGQTHQLSDYAGKVILVFFWATWCPECIFEMPSLQALSKALPDSEFILLSVNVGEDQERVRSFAQKHNLKFPILLDQDLQTYKKWPVLGIPTSFVINQYGKIVYAVIGAIDWSSQVTVSKIRALSIFNQSQFFAPLAKFAGDSRLR